MDSFKGLWGFKGSG